MKFFLTSVILVMLLTGCARHGSLDQPRSDPFEKFNRVVFDFNYSVMDHYVVRPVAVAWRNYMPQPVRNGLNNFTSNLEEPAISINYLLKGNIYHSMVHFTRFFLNSTLGMAGLIDVAGMSNPKLVRERSRRFGTTLAYYGVGYGPYLQVPFYGGFTLRDDGGNFVDHLYPMFSLLNLPVSVSKWLLQGIETRAQLLDSDALIRQSTDPYIFTRDAYFQYHDFVASGGKIAPQPNPNSKAIESNLNEIDTP